MLHLIFLVFAVWVIWQVLCLCGEFLLKFLVFAGIAFGVLVAIFVAVGVFQALVS